MSKWQMNRAGLLNYWYYDEEEFHFADGRLLLRGSNGSGKSVTMQSLITVLLDGVKTPDRLDSFGSRSRRIEDYLLGEKEIVNRDERTGYLFLEYKRQHTDQYVTTGIGLHAKRGGGVDFWGFIITDGRRLGDDLFLYKQEISPEDGSRQRIPLTRAELERSLGPGGQVVRSQKDYMELVNRHVFGFANIEQYQELMKLLIQLRSPKLSKDFKPSVIYEILNESLPSLSEEEIRPLSDTIESMERTKLQIGQLERDYQAISRLCRQYDGYNQYIVAEKAELLQRAERRQRRLERDGKEIEQQLNQARRSLSEGDDRQRELEREQIVLDKEKGELEQHDVFRAEQQKLEKEQELLQIQGHYKILTDRLKEKQTKERQEREQTGQYEQQVEDRQQEITALLTELDDTGREVSFDAHALLGRQVKAGETGVSFEVWRRSAKQHLEKLEDVQRILRRQSEARERRVRLEQDLGEERRLLDEHRSLLRKLEQQFVECREQLLAEIYTWQQQFGTDLPLEKEELRNMAQVVQGLYEGRMWQEVELQLGGAYGRQVEMINRERGLISAGIKQLEEKEKLLAQELLEWRNQRDPEPERLPDHAATRQLLSNKNIPYVPFYAAVEFQAQVPAAIRERLEAALTEMGLLDALIIPAGRAPGISPAEMYGSIILPNPQIMTATLADYLVPTPHEQHQVTAADIDEVLRSILIEDCQPWLGTAASSSVLPALSADDGSFRQGLVQGRAAQREAAKYIGKQARQEYRRKQIALLEAQLQELAETIATKYEQLQELVSKQSRVQTAKQQFPSEAAIRTIFQDKQAVQKDITRQEDQVKKVDSRLRDLADELQILRNQLQSVSSGLNLAAEETVYGQAVTSMGEYLDYLHRLELSWQDLQNSRGNAVASRRRLEDLCAEVDELKGELLVLDGRIKQYQMEISQIEVRLQEMGAAELREKVQRLAKRLTILPGEIQEQITLIANLQSEIRNHERNSRELTAKKQFAGQMTVCWQQLLEQELRLGLVYPAEEAPDYADIVLSKGHLLKQDRIDRTSLSERLSKSFAVENNILMEYRMQMEQAVTDLQHVPEPQGDQDDEEMMTGEMERLREKAQRLVITLDYNGRRQNPYHLQQVLAKQIEEQRAILSDKDKELYEEVIMNSIGRIISRRIHAAQQWVEEMNKLMQQRDTSSGLKFKLDWKARTAEQDEELDVYDLVRLLHADPATLREEDLARIVRHFQSRIEQAKQASEAVGGSAEASFQEAVRNILDYRKWYQFKLYYEQSGLNWRELSDKVFFKFSGGEKAMAMYIPLFSAAYSRYQEASPDAPYVITLDEAFAGVDENNIRDTFSLVEQLGFNYIMNSQALWGDYDVVPALAVCELIRPKNAPYVTVVRYYWNGQVRTLLHDELEQPEELIAAATLTDQ